MSKLQLANLVGSYILGTSVGFTVRTVIANNAQPETLQESLKLTVGSIAVGLVVAEAAQNTIGRQIDAGKRIWADVQEAKKQADLKSVPNN